MKQWIAGAGLFFLTGCAALNEVLHTAVDFASSTEPSNLVEQVQPLISWMPQPAQAIALTVAGGVGGLWVWAFKRKPKD